MKIFISLLFLLTACAKSPSEQTTAISSTPTKSAAASLESTESLGEGEAIRAASAAALAGENSLPASTAWRCWQREVNRPNVRRACLLAWAAAGQESPDLTSILRGALSGTDRVLAIAAARREGFAKSLRESEMVALVTALHAEAPWLRARVTLDWLTANKPEGPIDANLIFSALQLPESEGSPLSFASRFAVSRGLGLAKEAGWLAPGYCVPGAEGPMITRCLRALSALTDPRFGNGALELVRANLPPRNSNGTTFFQRSFPTRAHDFDNLY